MKSHVIRDYLIESSSLLERSFAEREEEKQKKER